MNINSNPIFKKNTNFDEALPFDKIKAEHFIPAIESSIQMARIFIDEICEKRLLPQASSLVL